MWILNFVTNICRVCCAETLALNWWWAKIHGIAIWRYQTLGCLECSFFSLLCCMLKAEVLLLG